MSASKHRTAFIFGAVVGATAGVAVAFWNAPQSGRRTRDQIQQAAERLIFRALDMVPFQNVPTDTVMSARPVAAPQPDATPPVDIVIGSRPSETGINQTP
jgi:hypothetical protein